jgi:hypothetical protein
MKYLIFSIILLFTSSNFYGQNLLKPGFDPDEYKTLLKISERQMDSTRFELNLSWPANYSRVYKSPITGMDNCFEIWLNSKNQTIVLSIRGTTTESISWIENFYSGMIPSEGSLKVDSSGFKKYKVAKNSKAYVHAGWMIGMMSMADNMKSQMMKYYDQGYRNFIIFGHSQGGAIAYLFRSYLEYSEQSMPYDMILKTISSAPPKVGNLYYAYDYEFITQGGWGIRVVNSLDWVPEVPFGTQTLTDINDLNPFSDVDAAFKNMGFFQRIYLKSVYKKLDKSTKIAKKRYTKYLGIKAFKLVKEHLPEAEIPNYSNSYAYTTVGSPIILIPGDAYFANYLPKATMGVFNHHMMYPYWLAAMETFPEKD